MESIDSTLLKGRVDLGRTALDYRYKSGDATLPPVLLLHPWLGCWQFWGRTMNALPHSSYAVDWYSVGRGAWQPFASPIGLSAAVLALMDEQQIDRWVVIGNSMGGIAAQWLAGMVPHRVSTLVLIGTGASTAQINTEFRPHIDEWMRDPNDVAKCTEMVHTLFASEPSAEEVITFVSELLAADKDFVTSVFRSAMSLDLGPRLRFVTADTTVIWGAKDRIRTKGQAQELNALIPGSTLVELPAAGHSPMVDDFGTFWQVLERVLGTG